MSSATGDNWGTPEKVLTPIRRFNRARRIALDPCSNPDSIVDAKVEWYGPHLGGTDGLMMPWVRKGLVYVNCPFSAKSAWVRKCANEAVAGSEIIALVPADTDTLWFSHFATHNCDHCFWRGRLTFRGDKSHPARFPCVLLYYGQRRQRFFDVFHGLGWVP